MDLTNILFAKALNKGDATKEYVDEAIKALKGEVNADLDTLEELSKALGNDPDFFLSIKNELDDKITKDELDEFKNEIVTGKDSATDNTKFAIGTAEQNLEVPSMEEFNQLKDEKLDRTPSAWPRWTTNEQEQARVNIGAADEESVNALKGDKVDKDEIFNAGIRSISYVPLFGGSFTVTTVEEEGYIKPHAISTVTGRISKHYTYRVTVNEEEYVLPCCLFSIRDNNNTIMVECLGNIGLYTSDVSGLMQDAIHDVPFCIISDIDKNDFIHVFTQSPCEVSITVERMQKEQTPLPKSLIWGDDYCPIELKKYENSVFNGISIGSNILKNSRGTVALGYGNEVSDEFGIAIGCNNTSSGMYSYAEGFSNTSSGTYSHAEGLSTTSSGRCSYAEGFLTIASGQYSHAEGAAATASGQYSHAEGSVSKAIGPCSHAEGQTTKANGAISHSGGNSSITDGRASFAHGNFSKATQPAQFAVGYGNDPQEDSIFEVGNGLNADGAPNNADNTEPVTRQNAFRVTQSGVAIAQTGLQIGNTVISEDQLKKILTLIE